MVIKRLKRKQEFIQDERTVSGVLQNATVVSWVATPPVKWPEKWVPGESSFSENYFLKKLAEMCRSSFSFLYHYTRIYILMNICIYRCTLYIYINIQVV